MISNRCAKTIQGKGGLFNKWLKWENWISTLKRMKLDSYLTPWRNELKLDEKT